MSSVLVAFSGGTDSSFLHAEGILVGTHLIAFITTSQATLQSRTVAGSLVYTLALFVITGIVAGVLFLDLLLGAFSVVTVRKIVAFTVGKSIAFIAAVSLRLITGQHLAFNTLSLCITVSDASMTASNAHVLHTICIERITL